MSNCKLLKLIKDSIDAGTPPADAIPYSLECANMDDYYEVLYYSNQVLPDGPRKDVIREKMEEIDNVRRTDSKL
jgi:hypothetical protein